MTTCVYCYAIVITVGYGNWG